MWDDTLREEVIASQYRSPKTREEVIAYYQQAYPGEKVLKNGQVRYEWKTKIVDAELALNPDAKRASLNKRYQKEKGVERYLKSKASPEQQAQYEALGQTLPHTIAPETINYTVRVYGEIRISSQCRPVDFTVTIGYASDFSLQGENAENFTDAPDVSSLVDAYFYGDPGYDGWCEGPYFEIN